MHTHRDYPDIIVWEGDKVLAPGMPYPTHFRGGTLGDLTPMRRFARYRHGAEVQIKAAHTGEVRTVVQIEFFQFRWHPPEPVYVLDNGQRVADHQLH